MKLKKSLLIVPALGTLLLAAAGSVGGTVAWFSANTTYDANAGNFSVASLEGNLSCTLGEGVGTTIATKTVTVESEAFLADASYDHDNRTVWTDASNVDGAASTFTKKTTLDPNTGAEGTAGQLIAATFGSTKHVYWAVTWKMTFTYVMPATGAATNLYFNHATSKATGNKQDGSTGTDNTYKGFRIAWTGLGTPTTTGCAANNRVWAPLRTDAPTSLKYVSGTETGAATAYTATNLIQSNSTGAVASTADNGGATAVNCLGQFVGAGNAEVSVAFICTAWYEGEDLAVRNTSSKDIVSSVEMHFFTLPNA